MKLKKNIAISETGFIFDPSSGNSFTTNAPGREIIKCIQEGKELNEIKEHFLKEYDTQPSIIDRDLNDFINVLMRLKLTD